MKKLLNVLALPFAYLVKLFSDWESAPSDRFTKNGGDGKAAFGKTLARFFYGGCAIVLLIGVAIGALIVHFV